MTKGATNKMNVKMSDRSARPRLAGIGRAALLCLFAVTLVLATINPAAASAAFGLRALDVEFTNQDGSQVTQAGSHPYAMTTKVELNYEEPQPELWLNDGGQLKDLNVEQIAGFMGNATALPQCSKADFTDLTEGVDSIAKCPASTAVGVAAANPWAPAPFFYVNSSIFNLEPPPGVPAELGFVMLGIPITIKVEVKPGGEYNLVASTINTSQAISSFGAVLQLWGNPSDPSHDPIRGNCVVGAAHGTGNYPATFGEVDFDAWAAGVCKSDVEPKAFLTLPTSCSGPAETRVTADSWAAPGIFASASTLTHDQASPPNPIGFTGCGKLKFDPGIRATPTTTRAGAPTGLDFNLNVDDEGLSLPDGLAKSTIKKATVRLPEGMTVNPSVAEGLGVCTPADYARETLNAAPGEGCPNSSKIGTVQVVSPLVDEPIDGSLFIAQQDDPKTAQAGAENPFDSLLALYIVFKNPNLGIIVKQAAKIETDARTGQLTTVVDGIPQLPFNDFHLHFREGGRSPLVTPERCGTFTAEADLVPWSDPSRTFRTTSDFNLTTGCPTGGVPPFRPGLIAGSINNAAGSYSPFNLRLTRQDGEQEITRFSIKLPPGIAAKLAGVPFCPEGAIAQAKSREQIGGGTDETASPSCPAASEVGRTLVGAGVGEALTYVPGKVYLAGPYNGSPLSIVAVTSGVVGPFDIGTVVVREALRINPETAEVFVDATGSDPIPHIIQGIPVHLRDIRVYVDKPQFVLNPTSCAVTSTASTLLGSGLDFASDVDDQPVTISTRYQASSCASLPYKPRLSLRLRGGTKRGAHPALRAVLRPRAGDANSKKISVALPHSEFLENAHIRTVCTRVQFAAGAGNGSECPKGAIYGRAKAWTPLFSEPLQGPIFLRSSENPLPDLVLALDGIVEVNAVGRIDSVDGGIRNTFDFVPDAPITKVVVDFAGGKKGLLVNSTDICQGRHRATVKFDAHNGKALQTKIPLKAACRNSR